ncbi:hypothetical protein, partial [Escherichia coli]|uniref:hypothetical protein n=1 Tax=Escherichia coli TaxID=562 RepID=UPI001FF31930
MLPSETMIWQPEFTDKTLSRKPGAVHMNTTGYARASLTVSLLQRLLLSIFFVMARSEFQKGRALSIIVSHNGDKPFPAWG